TPLLFLGALLPFLDLCLEIVRCAGTLIVLLWTDVSATLATAAVLIALAAGFFQVIQARLVRWGAAMNQGFGTCYRAVAQAQCRRLPGQRGNGQPAAAAVLG